MKNKTLYITDIKLSASRVFITFDALILDDNDEICFYNSSLLEQAKDIGVIAYKDKLRINGSSKDVFDHLISKIEGFENYELLLGRVN